MPAYYHRDALLVTDAGSGRELHFGDKATHQAVGVLLLGRPGTFEFGTRPGHVSIEGCEYPAGHWGLRCVLRPEYKNRPAGEVNLELARREART